MIVLITRSFSSFGVHRLGDTNSKYLLGWSAVLPVEMEKPVVVVPVLVVDRPHQVARVNLSRRRADATGKRR